MEDENRAAPGAHATDAADAAGDAAACYVERLVDIGADSPLFAAFYDADAGVWAWRLAWVDSAGLMRVVEGDIPDELLSRTCAQVRTVLFLPRRVPMTFFVSDRRDFPDYGGDGPRRSAAIAGRTRHG